MAYISLDLVAYCHTSSTREWRRKDSKELTYCQLPAAKYKSPAADYLTTAYSNNLKSNEKQKFEVCLC